MEESGYWIRQNLFSDDVFDGGCFEESIILYSSGAEPFWIESIIHHPMKVANFSRRKLFNAVMDSCEQHELERHAFFFHVNIHDNCAWVLE